MSLALIAVGSAVVGGVAGGIMAQGDARRNRQHARAMWQAQQQYINAQRQHTDTMHGLTSRRLDMDMASITDRRFSTDYMYGQEKNMLGLAQSDLGTQGRLANTQYGLSMEGLSDALGRGVRDLTEQQNLSGGSAAAFGGRGGSAQSAVDIHADRAMGDMATDIERERQGITASHTAQTEMMDNEWQRLDIRSEVMSHERMMSHRDMDRSEVNVGLSQDANDAQREMQHATHDYQWTTGQEQHRNARRQNNANRSFWQGAFGGASQGFQLGANVYGYGNENWEW